MDTNCCCCDNVAVEQTYPVGTIFFIKKVGHPDFDSNELNKSMVMILALMAKYRQDGPLQKACCDTISNLCMDVQVATDLILNRRIQEYVYLSLKHHYDKDWRLVLAACSAMWNMARSEEGRWHMNRKIVSLLITVMVLYDNRKNIINTAIGTLSNLALNVILKAKIGSPENIQLLLKIMRKNSHDLHVCTTATGLMANLAADNELSTILIKFGVFKVMSEIFAFEYRSRTFLYNSVALLSNCSSSRVYVAGFVEAKLIECLRKTHADDQPNVNIAISGLLINCLRPLGIRDIKVTTSYHLACKFGLTDIFYELLNVHHKEDELDFNEVDALGHTLMSYALENSHLEMISFLAACGASVVTDDIGENDSTRAKKIHGIIRHSRDDVQKTRKEYDVAIVETSSLNPHVGMMINSYISPYVLTEAKNERLILDKAKKYLATSTSIST